MRWLHISDLHMGCRGREVWWQVRSDLKDSIKRHCEHFQPIDMILVTGDLTFSAKPEQFDLFDKFLDELLGWLRPAGQEANPLVIPVPGNHDLVHLDELDVAPFYILENFWKDPAHRSLDSLRKRLWEIKSASYFGPLFGNYTSWLERSILPRLRSRRGVSVRRSHFPGDLSVFVDLPGLPPLTVVGLNSAWIQYNEGDFERKIELFTQQLGFALGGGDSGSPLDILDGRRNLLLMHHPPDWLSRKAEQRFNEEIYPPERFLLCLHGHMHEGRSTAISRSGGTFRYFFQAPSLFGMEGYGTPDESRTIGYVLGSMDEAGTVRVWPFKRDRQAGKQVFLWDREFKEEPAGASEESIKIVRREDGKETDIAGYQLCPLIDVQAALVATVDIVPWLEALLDRTGYIEISGIGSGVGRTKDASRYPIEQLYTTLRSRDAAEDLASRSGRMSLADLMSRHHLLLIEGQPGAGKTTFLRMVATMLARDRLGILCPDGQSWREKHLGMASRTKPPAPLFLKLSELATLLAEPGNKESSDDRRRLLDLLASTAGAADNEDWRKYWEGLLARGEAILLLDGLDEIADDRLRERVFAIFRNACQHWDKAPVVVTSRPFWAEAMREMGFHYAIIKDFGKEQIQEFIKRWMAALYNLQIGKRPEGAAGEKSDRIIRDVLHRPAIRRLAANPVMLTCLCVVHWNEGDLPEGRARLYRAVIRWLIAARTSQREQAGFTGRFAFEAFAVLAFAMMGGAKGSKTTVIDFEAGAEALLVLVERQFPKEIGIRRARDWLRFECLWSGIVEEPTSGKIRFWHLTFQEYLAAQELAWRRDGDGGAEDWWPMVRRRLDDLQWRETVDVLPGVLFDEGGSGRVDLLLRRVIGLRGEKPSLATNARFFGIVGRILGPMIAYSYKPPPEIERLYQELRDRILPMFGRDGAAKVPVKTRIAAAEALGRGGDPRLQGDTLIEVPDTDGVSLGKYPVTVTEYQAFVDAGGYHDSNYWDKAGWRLRREQQWEEPDEWDRQLEHPNLPVTGVSWYEARAYCSWRSSDSVWTVRLPTEAEWAAAMPDGRMYPWGSGEPDAERANFGGNVGRPTPVGVYPAGDGAFGHCDLVGNVWEWMEDEVVFEDEKRWEYSRQRVYRGGSWYNNSWDLRSAGRSGNRPDYRHDILGFRIARTLD